MATKKNPENFEHAFSELEQIVAQMESGQMSLESSLAAYQRGNALLEFCQKSLANVEQQVQILNERNQLAAFKIENE
jgi:exodeoxyribonuclease VII small subunit